MNIKVGDRVKVIAGREKGKEGKVSKTISKNNQVVIENLNMVKKHQKPDGQGNQGGIIEIEAPINVSNVKIVDAKKETKKVKKTTKKAKKQ